GALVFSPFPGNLMGERDRESRHLLLQQLPGLEFMFRVDVGMQETHGHCFNAFSADLLYNRLEVLVVQILLYRTIPAYSLTPRMDITRWDQWLRLTILQGIQLLAVASCDGVDIVKASSSHQQYTSPTPFQKCIQPDSSAVDQEPNLTKVANQIC